MRSLTRAAVLATVATIAIGGAVAVTGAASAKPVPNLSASVPAGTVVANNTSTYLAGYFNYGFVRRVTVRFVVPSVTCPDTTTRGIGVGVGNERTVGHPSVLAIVFVACVSGAPYYQTDAAVGSATQTGTAAAGDLITVSITQTNTAETATVSNLTQGTNATVTDAPNPDKAITYGAFPLFGGSTPLDVPTFATTTLSRPFYNGARLDSTGPTRYGRMSGSTLQIATSTFAANGSFRLVFQSNA